MSNALQALLLFLTLCLVTALPLSGYSAESTQGPANNILKLQKKYQQLHSLEFDFSQSTSTNSRVKQGSGKAVFYRPTTQPGASAPTGKGIMRWDYTEPMVQTIINDGKEFSIYTPHDKQLIISPAGEMESDITYAIFTGTTSLLEEFVASDPDRQFFLNEPPSGYISVLLTPRQPHPQVKRIQLWLSGDQTIHRLLMEDHFGSLTELTFSTVRFNTLPTGNRQRVESLLKLDLAPGTETIRQ